jgi:peptidoglycan/LPS O-acetylase OafA/YrhL
MVASPQTFGDSSSLEAFELVETKSSSSRPIINSSARIPELDGLRGIAILLVLFYHAVFEMRPSSKLLSLAVVSGRLTWSGVDLFFVLSGFLIGGILLDVRTSPRYFSTFYFRRAYRILPLYFAMVGVFSLRYFHGAGPLGNFSHSDIPWLSYLTFTQNFWMAALGTFGAGAMAATWSLAVEEQFYLTAPLIVRKISRERLVWVLLAVIGIAPLLRTALYFAFKNGGIAGYALMPCRADALSLGILVALAGRTPRWWNFILAKRAALKWVAWMLFAVLAILTPSGTPLGGPMVTIGYSVLAFFYAAMLLITVTGASGSIQRVLRSRMLMRLGGVSYFTYLFHLPLMEAMRRVIGLRFVYASEATQFIGAWAGIVVTLVLAAISWKYFEKPRLRIGQTHRY